MMQTQQIQTESANQPAVPATVHVRGMFEACRESRAPRQEFKLTPARGGWLQRKCACGGASGPSGECTGCQRKRGLGHARLQTKLAINVPGDRYEREADSVAERVLQMPPPASVEVAVSSLPPPNPSAQRLPAARERDRDAPEQDEEQLQAKPASLPSLPSATQGVTRVSAAEIGLPRLGGRGLPASERAFFEPRFGHDFSQVRIHDHDRAARLARGASARAFTSGRDVVFGSGQFRPGTATGRRLLAHELAHVVQQGGAPPTESAAAHAQVHAEAAPQLMRQALDVPDIMSDIRDGMSTHTDLFSWLHVMGERDGEVGHAADCPNRTCPASRPTSFPAPDQAPVPEVSTLPIIANFFPSFIRHTDQRALIIGGTHGDERPGYEMVENFVQELQTRPRPLAFHTLVIPRLNRGAIEDDLAGVTWYDRRCNRQVVDLNRNLPAPGASHSSTRCPNTPRAPVQPENQAVIDIIRQFQPHRILTAHAISTASSAGIFADPNTHPTATQLACSLAGRLVDPTDRPANRLTATSCNAVYPGDTAGAVPSGGSLGRYAPTESIPGETIPVITIEAPEYRSLGTGTGARTRAAYFEPLLAFVQDPASLSNLDAAIVRDIEAFSLPSRRLFLTGRLPTANSIFGRIESRINDAVAALNALIPRPPNRVVVRSRQRAFAQAIPGATPQAKIVFEKFTLTGSRSGGWDTLPDRFFVGGVRSAGVDRSAWLAESSATRLDIILRFSAIPGASRHHWGTEVDFNSTTNADWGATSGSRGRPGRFFRLGQWLEQNAHRVGFIKTYTAGRTGGVSEEAWHYSYEPIAGPLRAIYNRDVRLEQDIVDEIMTDWTGRAGTSGLTLPSDLRTALLNLDLSTYVNDITAGI